MRHSKSVRSLCLLAGLLAAGVGAAHAARQRHRVAPIGAYTTRGAWSFVSAPGLHPPRVKADARGKGRLASGLFMVTNFPNVAATTTPLQGEGGPMLLNAQLQPVWFAPVGRHVAAADLQQQSDDGKPVLTWWQGTVNPTGVTESGEDIVVDQHYHHLATLKAPAPWVISEHDMVITPPHDAWVTVYRNVSGRNLSRYNGSSHGTVYDAGVQEYDLSTGKLLHTWDALNPSARPNIPLTDSETRPTRSASAAWDAYHINAVQPIGANRFLISMRNTWGVYLIDRASGHVVWKLGGDPHKSSTFKVAPSARFEFQHDARLAGSRLTMFDDACCNVTGPHRAQPPLGPSRGLALHLDFAHHRATLAHQYLYKPKRDTFFLGSTRTLPNGNVLVGWGSLPYFSEYSGSGRLLLDAVFPGGGKDINYRALFTASWVGTPSYPPSAGLRTPHGAATIYASWNGATQVARWEALAGSNAHHLHRVASARESGFETAIRLPKNNFEVYAVKALDAAGHVLGTSHTYIWVRPRRRG